MQTKLISSGFGGNPEAAFIKAQGAVARRVAGFAGYFVQRCEHGSATKPFLFYSCISMVNDI